MLNIMRNLALCAGLVLILAGCGETVTPSPTATQPPTPTSAGGSTGTIAFVAAEGSSYGLYLLDLASGEAVWRRDSGVYERDIVPWSPDGRKLAYCVWKNGLVNIIIFDVASGDQKRVRLDDGGCQGLAWSPDGKHIVYADRTTLNLVDLATESFTNLTPSGYFKSSPVWSPDGSQIAYAAFLNDTHEIFVMNADGSARTALTHTPGEADDFPQWSPDGTRIAYSVVERGTGITLDVRVMNTDGSDNRPLANNPNYDYYEGVSWSPDGSLIAIICRKKDTLEFGICQIDEDGSHFKVLYTSKDQYLSYLAWQPVPQPGPAPTARPIQTAQPTAMPTVIALPAPGEDGRIAFDTYRDGSPEIYLVNPDGSGLQRLTDNFDEDTHPSWSPDGRRILFSSNRDGNGELYIMDANGQNQVRLTHTPDFDEYNPQWSPDGKHILLVDACWNGCTSDLYVTDSDGGGRVNLTSKFGLHPGASWSPDGASILSEDRPTSWTPAPDDPPDAQYFYIVPLDGSAITRLKLIREGDMIKYALSLDGKTLLFEHGLNVFTTGIDTFSPLRLAGDGYPWLSFSFSIPTTVSGIPTPDFRDMKGHTQDRNPVWSRDGKHVAFLSDREQEDHTLCLWVMDADGAGVHRATDFPVFDPAWSPAP